MKSFANTEIVDAKRLSIPYGTALPRIPMQGEVFYLLQDWPAKYDPLLPWYPRAVYVYDGVNWQRLSDLPRERRAAVIGSQDVDNERPFRTGNTPTSHEGHELASITLTPTFPLASLSGMATIWVDTETLGWVTLVAWRKSSKGNVLVGMTATKVEPNSPLTMALTFYDMPKSREPQTYSLRVYSDIRNKFYVNRGMQYPFDGVASTAFIVEENT